jgi:hypothetical protein
MAAEQNSRTTQLLLACVQSPQERFKATVTLKAFCDRYPDIGRREGKSIYLSAMDKEKIRAILAVDGVDSTTPREAWHGRTRAEALALANDEKLAGGAVKRHRVAIKALRPGQPIRVNGQSLVLPPRGHLDLDLQELTDIGAHDSIVVVENWEAFNEINRAAAVLAFPGDQPLVVWRGDTSATRADAMLEFVQRMTPPVAAFVDYDPAGLLIAARLPRLAAIIAPPDHELERLLQEKGLPERYLEQLAGCQAALDRETNPLIVHLWGLFRRAGRALPQEHWVRLGGI